MTLNHSKKERTRTITWEDSKISARDANTVCGLELFIPAAALQRLPERFLTIMNGLLHMV